MFFDRCYACSTWQHKANFICAKRSSLKNCSCTSVRSSVGFKKCDKVRQSSITSNTFWGSVNFFGQITIQRYFVFVSTVQLRTSYIQKRPKMNTFCEYNLKKIGPTHAHFQYSARKLMPSLKSVLLLTKIESLQRRATKFILNTHWQEDISYHERLSRLNLLPLTYWHEVKDLIFYFKCRAGHYTLPIADYVKPKGTRLTRHSYKALPI